MPSPAVGPSFLDSARAILRQGYIDAYASGYGDADDEADEGDWGDDAEAYADEAVDRQSGFLAGLAALLVGGALSEAMIDARMGQYAATANPAYERGFSGGVQDQGQVVQVRWESAGDEDVCQLCADRDGQVWAEGDDYPFPGEGGFGEYCEGAFNCRCSLVYELVPAADLADELAAEPDLVEALSAADLLKIQRHLLRKYSDDQPRADDGRWTDSGGGGSDAGAPPTFASTAEASDWIAQTYGQPVVGCESVPVGVMQGVAAAMATMRDGDPAAFGQYRGIVGKPLEGWALLRPWREASHVRLPDDRTLVGVSPDEHGKAPAGMVYEQTEGLKLLVNTNMADKNWDWSANAYQRQIDSGQTAGSQHGTAVDAVTSQAIHEWGHNVDYFHRDDESWRLFWQGREPATPYGATMPHENHADGWAQYALGQDTPTARALTDWYARQKAALPDLAALPTAALLDIAATLTKYSDDQPRDDSGRWTDGGGGGAPDHATMLDAAGRWSENSDGIRDGLTHGRPSEDAKTLLAGLAAARSDAPTLTRGITLFAGHDQDAMDQFYSLEPGSDLHLNLSSWTTDGALADYVAWDVQGPSRGDLPIVLELDAGAQALNLSGLLAQRPEGDEMDQHEWLTGGAFRVVDVQRDYHAGVAPTYAQDVPGLRIRVTQTAYLANDPEAQVSM